MLPKHQQIAKLKKNSISRFNAVEEETDIRYKTLIYETNKYLRRKDFMVKQHKMKQIKNKSIY